MRVYKPEGVQATRFTGYRKSTLEFFMKEGSIIEAPVSKCDNEMNLHIDLGQDITGIIPFSEFEYSPNGKETKNVAVISKVAKVVAFKIINIETDDSDKTIVTCSRKQAQLECKENYIDTLKRGQVIDARITHIENYGAFCDIGCGIVALLPIEHFCVARIKEPKKALRRFKNLKVIVRDIDENGRLILSQKELLGTWEEEVSKFKTGDVVTGIVRVVESYGTFVELTPNLAGLAEPLDGVKVGAIVSVYIKSIIPEKMKVKLLIVGTENLTPQFIKLDYRMPEDGIVRHWRYSPSCCDRIVETVIETENLGTNGNEQPAASETTEEAVAVEETVAEAVKEKPEATDVAEQASEETK